MIHSFPRECIEIATILVVVHFCFALSFYLFTLCLPVAFCPTLPFRRCEVPVNGACGTFGRRHSSRMDGWITDWVGGVSGPSDSFVAENRALTPSRSLVLSLCTGGVSSQHVPGNKEQIRWSSQPVHSFIRPRRSDRRLFLIHGKSFNFFVRFVCTFNCWISQWKFN